MEIKTKFNVGDKIYTVDNCAIKELVVNRICIFVYKDRTNIRYECDKDSQSYSISDVTEENAFPSREALLYNLQNS